MATADEFLDSSDSQSSGGTPPQSADAFLDTADPNQKPSVGMDMLKSGASGVAQGVASAPYWLGDLANLAGLGTQKAYEYYRDMSGQPLSSAKEHQIESNKPLYGSDEILKPAEDLTGVHPYQPQTTAGDVSNFIGNMVGFGGVAAPKASLNALSKTGDAINSVENASKKLPGILGDTSSFGPTAQQYGGVVQKIMDIVSKGEKSSQNLPGMLGDVSSGKPSVSSPKPDVVPSNLQNIAPGAWARANDILSTALNDEGMTHEQIAKNLEEANKMDLPVKALDVATKNVGGVQVQGKNILGLADAATNMPGQGAAMGGDLASRGYTAKQRIGDLFNDAISKSSFYDMKDETLNRMATDAPPAYEKAFSQAPVYNDRIGGFLQEPEVQSGIKRGLQIQRLEARAKEKPFDPMDYGITGFNDSGDPIISGTPNMRLLDAGKKGLDAMISDNQNPFTGKLNELGGALQQVKGSYVKTLDDVNPNYAAARQSYADPASNLRALKQGRSFTSMDPEEIDKFMQDPATSNAEKQYFLAGARRNLQDSMSAVGDNANAATKLWKENIRNRIEPMIVDKGAFQDFSNKMDAEQNMVRNNSALTRQSATMPRQQYAEMINQQPQGGVGKLISAIANPYGAAKNAALQGMSNATAKAAKGMTSDTAAAIMHYLTSDDPQLWRNLANKPTSAGPGTLKRAAGVGTGLGAAGLGASAADNVHAEHLSEPNRLKIDISNDPNIGPDGLPRVNLPGSAPQSQNQVPKSFQQAENMKESVYKDNNGNRTVGIGFNMDNPTAPNIWQQAGMTKDFNAVRNGKQTLNNDEAQKLLGTSYNIARQDIKSLVPNIGNLSNNQQEALTHLAFQYGKPRLREALPGVLTAANMGNPKAAAARLMASDYARQFPTRAKALARSLFNDEPVSIGG